MLPAKNNNFADINGERTKIFQRSPQEELGGGNELHKKMGEASAFIRRSIEAAEKEQQRPLTGNEKREVENKAALDYAQQNNIWVEDLYSLGNPLTGGGNEHTLAYDVETGTVYKANNLFNAGYSVMQFLEQLKNHNEVFPENKYELIGFTGLKNEGTKRAPHIEPIIKQKYIPDVVQTTIAEIDSFMKDLGFEKAKDFTYSNGKYTVADMRPRNVLKDGEGNIHVIDDIVTRNR